MRPKEAQPTTSRYSRGYLPRRDAPGEFQAVTFRLFDSLPSSLRLELADLATNSRRFSELLDKGYGACYLRDPQIATQVEETLQHFDGSRYQLHAWSIMPNHVHVIFRQHIDWPLSSILHSWKSYTATVANRLLDRRGAFWQREAFDRVIRGERHYARAVRYVHLNPVSAGLCASPEEWRFSSARRWATGELPPFGEM